MSDRDSDGEDGRAHVFFERVDLVEEVAKRVIVYGFKRTTTSDEQNGVWVFLVGRCC